MADDIENYEHRIMKKVFTVTKDFFTDSYSELLKVSWPNRQTVIYHTIAVIVVMVVATVIIAVADIGLSKTMEYFIISRI